MKYGIMDDSDLMNLYPQRLHSIHSEVSSSGSNDLSVLERDINQIPDKDNIDNLKNEIMHSLNVDQREQINFLKDEILFLREESRQKNKYIEMLYKDRSKKCDSTSTEEEDDIEHEDQINSETDLSSLMNSLIAKKVICATNNINVSEASHDTITNKYKYVTIRKEKNKNHNYNIQNHISNIREEKHRLFLQHIEKENNTNDTNACYDEFPTVGLTVEDDEEYESITDKRWPPNTTLITGDSILNNLEERRMNKQYPVKIRQFPGPDIQDMFHYISPLLQRMPQYIILHIGCNDAPNKNSNVIFNGIMQLKTYILSQLPKAQVIISCPVLRTDSAKAQLTLKRLRNNVMKGENIIIHDNIDNSCLGKAGLHLNAKGTGRLAMNFISLMRRL